MESFQQYQSPVSIILADSVSENYQALAQKLTGVPVVIIQVVDPKDIVAKVQEQNSALVFMDVDFAAVDDFQAVTSLRQTDETKCVPIVLLADGEQNKDLVAKGYEAGCIDVLLRPLQADILRAKLRVYLDLYKRQLELQKANEVIRLQNRLLQQQATRDGLTGLYNHIHFQELFAQQFYLAKRHDYPLALLMLDIDFFKEVNDSYGHQVGDTVLKKFAEQVRAEIRQTDILARYGGEEFVIVLPDTAKQGGMNIAEKIRETIEAAVFTHNDINLQVTVSIGLALFDGRIKHPAELIEQADHALYQAKAGGRNRVHCFEHGSKAPYQPCGGKGRADLSCIRERLRTTLEKTRASALAFFEAMVHSQTYNQAQLRKRNTLAARMVKTFGKRLNLPNTVVQSFLRSFKLHDLLRLFICDAALSKEGSLDEAELAAIRDQPLMLKELTDLFDFFADERAILRYHHEYYDGSGYPEGLDGYEIPMGARLFALVDAFVAMSSPSYSREPMSPDRIVEEIERQSGKQFDPFLVNIMLEVIRENRDLFVNDGDTEEALS